MGRFFIFVIFMTSLVIIDNYIRKNIGKASNNISVVDGVSTDTLGECCCGITKEDEKALNAYLYDH